MLVELEPPYVVIKPGVSEAEFYSLEGEDSRWEYLDGRLVMAAASNRYEDLFRFLLTVLSGFLEERGDGVARGSRYPMRLDERWSPEPDLLAVCGSRVHLLGPQYLDGPADLVIEIASEWDPHFDEREKIPRYLAARIPEIWLVEPGERRVRAWTLAGAGYETAIATTGRLASRALPGFWLEAAWLWQEPLPKTLACLREILA
jgi:Uma2 family endonuclease